MCKSAHTCTCAHTIFKLWILASKAFPVILFWNLPQHAYLDRPLLFFCCFQHHLFLLCRLYVLIPLFHNAILGEMGNLHTISPCGQHSEWQHKTAPKQLQIVLFNFSLGFPLSWTEVKNAYTEFEKEKQDLPSPNRPEQIEALIFLGRLFCAKRNKYSTKAVQTSLYNTCIHVHHTENNT